jgi:2-methylcitrate dehydratase PrpD
MLKLLAAGTGTMAMGGSAALSRATAPCADTAAPATAYFTFSERIADYIVRARFTDLPAAAIHAAKEQIALFLGRILATSPTEYGSQIRCSLLQSSDAAQSASVIGDRLRLCVADAACANAMLFAGSLAGDDALDCADVHAGAFILPTAITLGEARRVSGRDLILALVSSHEVLGKLRRAALQWSGPLPCHSTSIFGGLGSMTVAGSLLRLDHERMTHAVSAGAHLSLSMAQGSMMHHYCGQIVRNATRAVQLVESGAISYSRTVLDGKHGLYSSLLDGESGQLTQAIDRLDYEEIVTATQPRNLTSDRIRQDWLAASDRRLLSRKQLRQLRHLVSHVEQVDDLSTLLATAIPSS